MGMHRKFEAALKAKVALEAIKGEKTLAQISSEYGVHATQVTQWKQELIQRSIELFTKPNNTMAQQQEELTDKLHKTIGEITMENNWLKKKLQILG